MTENKSSDKVRTKLTLKLPNSSAETLAIPTQQKSLSSKKISNSMVQVTIKGRKKTSSETFSSNKSLNSGELEAKIKVLEASLSSDDSEIKTHEILKKQLKLNKKEGVSLSSDPKKESQEKALSEDGEDIDNQAKQIEQNDADESIFLQSESDSENIIPVNALQKTEFEEQSVKIEPKETQESQPTSYSSDLPKKEIDVRSKIRQSIEEDSRQKLAREKTREKIAEERRQKELELQKLKMQQEEERKQQTIKNDSKKPKKNFADFSEENDRLGKKVVEKDSKSSGKKYTYFIGSSPSEEDSEDDSGYVRRKRFKPKSKHLQNDAQKEYKKIAREVILPDLIIVSDLAERMSEKAGDVVKKLFAMGMVVTSNQSIDAETAEIIIHEFGHSAKRVSRSDVENVLEEDYSSFEKIARAPVVTIMGHVDHGKTSLLDALRETDVVSSEHGGITQHIGASRIKTKDGKYITFLDTPGHEAFTEMRSRGANITDIVVLVVAADDGVKEQTIEAIHHAKAANVPIIVAVNKIDKPGANPQNAKNELLNYELVAEDMGGDIMFVEVSAKAKTNLDKLEEAILLQAEMLDLKAPILGKSSGVVLEARIDAARGVVATVLVQNGTLDISDLIVAGTSYGKIRKMSDHNGKNISQATASMPVEIFGLDCVPNAGDKFVEVDEDKQARDIIAYRQRQEKDRKNLRNSARSVGDIFKQEGEGRMKYLNIILKSDVHGSLEAISGSIAKILSDEVAVKIIHSATGGITESDVSLASASGAIIIGFNVRANPSTKDMASDKGVSIRYYSVIYNLIDDLKLMLSGLLNPAKKEEFLGIAEIRQVFKVSGAGKVAGCMVIDGQIKRNAKARLLRNNVVIFDGDLKTLKRFKDDVKEVKFGFECGIAFENYDDLKEGDSIECYEIIEEKRMIN